MRKTDEFKFPHVKKKRQSLWLEDSNYGVWTEIMRLKREHFPADVSHPD